MARRKRVYDKPTTKDSRYDSEIVAHLINRVMASGKIVADLIGTAGGRPRRVAGPKGPAKGAPVTAP